MRNVTDRISNPFGMDLPCEAACTADIEAVHGYGDANADFHFVGDHPGVHGGRETGIPFTDAPGMEAFQNALHEVGFLEEAYSDAPRITNIFASYLHPCCVPEAEDARSVDGRDVTYLESSLNATPDPSAYARLERFLDAELRAINAHILCPVGERATQYVLDTHTTRVHAASLNMAELHATEIRGRGFLVVPIRDPAAWEDGDGAVLVDRLQAILNSDYRQLSDLGRFMPDDEPYLVR